MDFDFASQPGKPDMLLGMDVNEDAIVIINAEGLILLVSQVKIDRFNFVLNGHSYHRMRAFIMSF